MMNGVVTCMKITDSASLSFAVVYNVERRKLSTIIQSMQ